MKCIKYLLFIVLGFSNVGELVSQHYDNQWLFGYHYSDTSEYGLTVLDFSGGIVSWTKKENTPAYYLGFTGSYVNSYDGELQYFTNGCTVKNFQNEIVSGEQFITETGDGYPTCESEVLQDYAAYQSNILLPDLINANKFYIVHNDFHVTSGKPRAENMNFSVLDYQDGITTFLKKGSINSQDLTCLRLTAVPSHDLAAWWVVMPQVSSNVFETYRIENDSAYLVKTQEIGIDIECFDLSVGQAQFSNDASMLGINSEKHGVMLYDFDNETGTLSNFRTIPYPFSEELAQGLVFSMDNTKLYVNSAQYLYQIDLDNDNEITLLAEVFEPDETGWPISLGVMFMGPDCKIYIAPGSTTHFIHTIELPNNTGEACNFRKNRIDTPTNIAHDFPNIAQYRYINSCDSTIVLPEIVPVIEQAWKDEMLIYPNPARTQITINALPDVARQLFIFDGMGQLVRTIDIDSIIEITIDINEFPTGIYYVSAVDEKQRAVSSKRFVKQE